MKLAIYRSLFACAALGVASLAAAAWQEPTVGVYGTSAGEGLCLFKSTPAVQRQAHPDQDLLLFMYGLTQGVGSRS
jgi:hypothetical protein